MPQPSGPRGRHPKKVLTPGVWTTTTSAATLTPIAASTVGRVPPSTIVWASWVPTSATSPTVRARVGVPLSRAINHALVAADAVVPARTAMSRSSTGPSEASGPARSSDSGVTWSGSRSAIANAGAMSVSRFTSSSCRGFSGACPPSTDPASVKPISPRLPPTRIATAPRTDSHMERPSTTASTMVSMRSSVTTTSALARAASVPRRPRAMPASASRMAAASLAPSPVIATGRPMRW